MRLTGAIYNHDNGAVFDILKTIIRDHDSYTWIKSFSSTRNGRLAFAALCTRYLGAATTDNLVTNAEAKLTNTFYSGDSRRFNFDIFINIIQSAIKDKGSVAGPMDEADKIRILLR